MPVLVSIIVPTLDEAEVIQETVQGVCALPGLWEVIVADAGSTDGTRGIVSRMPDIRLVDVPRGRGAGMNGGARVASGDILVFLHADTHLPAAAYELITTALSDPATSATAFRLRLDRDDFPYSLVPLASRVRVLVQRTFFGDQAMAMRRIDFDRVGGFGTAVLMEDVDLSHRLRRIGRLRTLPADVVTSSRRFERYGVFRTLGFMACLQVAYACRVPANRLARWYADVR